MGLPNKDEVKGKFDQAKGLVKGKIGRALGDRKMKDEGDAERGGAELASRSYRHPLIENA